MAQIITAHGVSGHQLGTNRLSFFRWRVTTFFGLIRSFYDYILKPQRGWSPPDNRHFGG
jgi:hypothetical protein